MKRFKTYLPALALSLISAFILDLSLNFDEYHYGWKMAFSQNRLMIKHSETGKIPKYIGKATAQAFIWLLK